MKFSRTRGFTLIELLVVMAIIAILSVSVIARVSAPARAKARETVRARGGGELQKILELYNSDYGHYPTELPLGQMQVRGECYGYEDDYIPGLVPLYLDELPTDPTLDCGGITHGWVYATDGYDYKLITHGESPEVQNFRGMVDTAWDGGSDDCILDGSQAFHYGVWTTGAQCWRI